MHFIPLKKFIGEIALAGVALLLFGCAGTAKLGAWSGPASSASVKVLELTSPGPKAELLQTAHYKIYSTIDDRPDFMDRMAQLMEGAFSQYRRLAPDVAPTDHTMECYIFAQRMQWVEFTRRHTGIDAPIYLQINRGGYTIHDWYVAYYIGDMSTFSVAAHEGWHQFVARHFLGRLPPFLEEGLACMFENVQWDNDLPRWNLSLNPARAMSLRKSIDDKELWPLAELVRLHAGDVVKLPGARIEAFYAQNWAFAKFLWEGQKGKYRPALQRLLADTATGTVKDPTGSLRRSYLPFNPNGVGPMLETYLGSPLGEIDRQYQAFIREIAYDQHELEWGM